MNTSKIIMIVCWALVAIVLIGFMFWVLTGNLFGIKTNFKIFDSISFNFDTIETLTGPYNEVGTYKVPVDDIESISVDWVAGDVTMTSYDGDEIQIGEYAQRDLNNNETLQYVIEDGILKIYYKHADVRSVNLRKKIELLLPENLAKNLSQLMIESTSADVNLRNVNVNELFIDVSSGFVNLIDMEVLDITAKSISGDIRIKNIISTEIDLNSISGSLDLMNVNANILHTESTSGEQSLIGVFRKISSKSISGDIVIETSEIPEELYAKNTSGDIQLNIPTTDSLVVSYSSVSGNFSSTVPVLLQGNSAAFEFITVSGDIAINNLG